MSLELCEDGHEPITYEYTGKGCPLCEALESLNEIQLDNESLEYEIRSYRRS